MEKNNRKDKERNKKRMVKYFFDSYAVIEVLRGSSNYARYSKEVVVITMFNLVETYWSALNNLSQEKANEIYKKYKECVVEVSDEIIKEAIKFRKENKKRDLSYADCIGYIYALRNSLIFLTGDKEFEGLKNVEFIK